MKDEDIRITFKGVKYHARLVKLQGQGNYNIGINVFRGKDLLCGTTAKDGSTIEQLKESARLLIKHYTESCPQ